MGAFLGCVVVAFALFAHVQPGLTRIAKALEASNACKAPAENKPAAATPASKVKRIMT